MSSRLLSFALAGLLALSGASILGQAHAEEETAAPDPLIFRTKAKKADETVKPAGPERFFYYDYRTSERFCLSADEALRKRLGPTSKNKPCTDEDFKKN